MKVFYQSLVDFFVGRKFLFALILLAFVLPRLFYGIYVYYYGDAQFYYFSLGKLTEYMSSIVKAGWAFGLNEKKVIFIMSMLTTIVIGIGVFRKGYLFSKSKIAATYTLLLYLIHPLTVWYSGEPRTVHFTHSFFIGGIFLLLNQNKKLLWKNLLGIILLFIATKTNPGLYPYIVLFFIFNIFESMLSKSALPQNYFILIGQALTFVFCSLIFIGWNDLTPLSHKILSQVQFFGSFMSDGGNALLTKFPDMLDEYFRNLIKSFFSPVLIIFPIIVLGFGREIKLSNYSRGLYSISFLVIAMYFLELKNLASGNYEQMYAAIVFSILVSSIGCHRLYNRFKYPYVRAIIVLLLPISLAIGLLGRGYRDFYRQQSIFGIMPEISKNIKSSNNIIYLPFGKNLNAKGFNLFKKEKSLNVFRVPQFKMEDYHQLLQGQKIVYMFLDDYFIFNFYWHGKNLLEINDQVTVNNVLIKKLFTTDTPNNKGYLFSIEWKK